MALLKSLTRRRKCSKNVSLVEFVKTQKTKLPCVVCITDINTIADAAENPEDHFKIGDIILMERKLQVKYIRFEVLDNGSDIEPKVNNQRKFFVGREFLIPLEYEGFVTPKHKTYSKRTYYNCLREVEENDLKLIQVEEDTLSFTMKDMADFIRVQKGINLQRRGSVIYEKQRFLSFVDHDRNCYFFHEAHPMKFSAYPPIQPLLLKNIADISLPRIVSFNTIKKQNLAPIPGMDANKMYVILDGPIKLLKTEERDVLIVWKPDLSETAIIPKGLQSRTFVEICKPTGKSNFFHNSRFVENKLYFLKDSLHQATLFKCLSETVETTWQDLNEVNTRINPPVVNTSDEMQNLNGPLPTSRENEKLLAIWHKIAFEENPLFREDFPSLETYKCDHASGEYIDMDLHEDLYEYEVMESPGIIDGDELINRYDNNLSWSLDSEPNDIKQNTHANKNITHPHLPSRQSVDERVGESEDDGERSEENVLKDCIPDCLSCLVEAVPKQNLSEFRQGFDELLTEEHISSGTGEHFPDEIIEKSSMEKDKHGDRYKGICTSNVKQESILCRGMKYPALPPKPVFKKPYCDSLDTSKRIEINSEAKGQVCYDSDYEFCSGKALPKQNVRKDIEISHVENPVISSSRTLVYFPNETKERRKIEKEIYCEGYKSSSMNRRENVETSKTGAFGDMPLIADIPQILEESYQPKNETNGKSVRVCVVRPLVK